MNEGIGTEGMAGNDHYRMTVDLNVLDHLGINLYSNIAADCPNSINLRVTQVSFSAATMFFVANMAFSTH